MGSGASASLSVLAITAATRLDMPMEEYRALVPRPRVQILSRGESHAGSMSRPIACLLAALSGIACNNREAGIPRDPRARPSTESQLQDGSDPIGLLNPRVERSGVARDIPAGLGALSGIVRASPGTSASQQVLVDSSSRVYLTVLRQGEDARYSIADPAGALIACSNCESNATEGHSYLEACVLEAPPVGTLEVTLTAGAEDAQLNYTLYFANGRRMVVGVTPTIATPSSRIVITAKIVDADGAVLSGGLGGFSATVNVPDGATQTLILRDDGQHDDGAPEDGVLGGSYEPVRSGRYHVSVAGSRTVGTEQVSRVGETAFVVSAAGASFAGGIVETPVDADGNGLYDTLTFSQGVTFTTNGHYTVVAELMAGPIQLTTLRWSFADTVGATTQTAVLSVAGRDLVRHNQPGPWTLSNMRISREDVGALITVTAPDHVTQTYQLSQFERPAAPEILEFTPTRGSWKGGEEIRIAGRGLAETKEVIVGGRSAAFTLRGNYDLGVVTPDLPESPLESRGVDVKVITPWGQCVAPQRFVYTR